MNTEKYVIPFIEGCRSESSLLAGQKVLEIGSAEGGVLKAFINSGCTGIGVELASIRVNQANEYLKEDIEGGKISIYLKDIFDPTLQSEFFKKFDLIVLKDVIEHIHQKESLLKLLHSFLKANGQIYFGFPPWRMPFGGHQQICKSKFLSRLPWIHLLPAFLYKSILKAFHEDVDYLMDIKQTGLSINQFEQLVNKTGYKITDKKHYLINPIYEFKFGLKPREQYKLITRIPYFKDFLTTCVYYLIERNND